jgi:16S rRNA (adenine1518-N6/adenine1519-N6)-dimethyltransferase
VGRPFGQHFLADRAILDAIVDALRPAPSDVVLEVGAGTGTLTRRLAPRVARVIAVEKDRRLAAELLQSVGGREPDSALPDNVAVVAGDALDLDWHVLLAGRPRPGEAAPARKIVGNIPYYLTSPLIDKALTPPLPAVVVYLVQREVAERLVATPGTRAFGALTAGVAAVARTERLRTVPPGAFRPAPRVSSALVRFTPLSAPMVDPLALPDYRAFLAALFGQRRKQLGRSVRNLFGVNHARADELLRGAGISPDRRPEMLTPQELVKLFRATRALTPRPEAHKL